MCREVNRLQDPVFLVCFHRCWISEVFCVFLKRLKFSTFLHTGFLWHKNVTETMSEQKLLRDKRSTRLRSLVPKVLLYDNVNLTRQLTQVVTNLSLEERKSADSWTQVQRRFITRQVLKEETHKVSLFPHIPSRKVHTTRPVRRSLTVIDIGQHSVVSQDKPMESSGMICSHGRSHTLMALNDRSRRDRPRRNRRDFIVSPMQDSRFLQLHTMLTEVKSSTSVSHNLLPQLS